MRGTLPESGVAIIGSRTPPTVAETFAYDLAIRLGEPIVSGLALGIDAAAHRGALAAGVPTVAFVGHGFGCTYPPEHADLEIEIVRRGGAVATLEPPQTPASEESLVKRDRLQAKFARAVVLVCSELEGGAMHTMHFAEELAKPRFAVIPSDKGSGVWAGNFRSIERGAEPIPLDVAAALQLLRRT